MLADLSPSMKNPCNGMVKSDIGKPTQKKEALTLEQQKRFVKGIVGNTYEYQYKFLLQTAGQKQRI